MSKKISKPAEAPMSVRPAVDSPPSGAVASLYRVLGIEGAEAPSNADAVKWGIWLALAAMILRAIFWIYTQRYWEDALITCLHTENFVTGHGMTHIRPGEPPLHGFTSPLSVLVPLIGDLMHVGWGVDFIKLVSIPAAAATVLYLVGVGIHPAVRLPLPLIIMCAGYAAVDHQQILFGMAGMETQLATLCIVASLYHAIAWHPARLGVWLGLCMLARPDFAFWCAIIGVYGLFRDARRMPVVIGLALAVYLPWIAFTLYEYGSPIPNTLVAKQLGYQSWLDKQPSLNLWILLYGGVVIYAYSLLVGLAPTFMGHGTFPIILIWQWGSTSPIALFMGLFALAGLIAIVWRKCFALWPMAAALLLYSFYYVYLVSIVVGWYKPFYHVLLVCLTAYGLHACAGYIRDETLRLRALRSIAYTWLALFVCVLPYTFYAEHQIQKYVENGVRKQAGLFMRDQLKPDEAVGCEPLGYMGYYSRGNVYDWPGLDSRKVVAWSKSVPKDQRSLQNMLMALQPEYVYLRDVELMSFEHRDWFVQNYHPLKQFAVAKEDLLKIPWVDQNFDISFWILQKNRPDAPSAPNP